MLSLLPAAPSKAAVVAALSSAAPGIAFSNLGNGDSASSPAVVSVPLVLLKASALWDS